MEEPPTNLSSTAPLTIAENQPIGTIVGEFTATDPEGGAVTYSLINGDGFTLDANGTLKTAVVFDYETDGETHEITVQAKDELNATVEGNFTVYLFNDPASVFVVSGGHFGAPYYEFTNGLGEEVDFSSLYLKPGEIYQFMSIELSTSHPFMIGESYGDMDSPMVSGEPLSVDWDELTVTIPFGFSGDLYYFCTNHSGMIQEFKVQGDTPLDDSNFYNAVALWFLDEGNATAIYGHISDWNTSAVTNMSGAFEGRADFNESIGGWNTSSVIDMSYMFAEASAFNQYIGEWNTSSVYNMIGIFEGASSFNQSLDGWDVSSVAFFDSSFEATESLSNLNKGLLHQAYSANDYWPYDWAKYIPPQEIISSRDLNISENQSAGTLISEFSSADANDGDITFHFINDADGNYSYFTLEQNGTLRSAITFDYETNASTYTVQIQAKDELNATTERNFTIHLQDIFEDLDGDEIEDHLDDDIDGDGFTNHEEEAYPSDPRNPNSVANTPPHVIEATEFILVTENIPLGTIVAELQAEDADVDEVLNYSLATGLGDDDNHLFTIDENGTLRTADQIDYEESTELTILLRATDPTVPIWKRTLRLK